MTPQCKSRFTELDLPAFIAYRNDPLVARYQGWEGISEADADAFLQEQKQVQLGMPGQGMQIAVEFKETGVLVGDCYFIIHEQDEQQAEIGWHPRVCTRGKVLRRGLSRVCSPMHLCTFISIALSRLPIVRMSPPSLCWSVSG